MLHYKHESQPVVDNSSYKLYYDRSIITHQTIHSDRPDTVILDKNYQRSLLNTSSNSSQSQPSEHHYQESSEVYRLGRRAYKNLATESSLHSTTSTIHNRYHSKQITQKFKIA